MAFRPFVSQLVQIGPEVIAGLPVAATKRLQALRMVPGVEDDTVDVTPMGYLYPTVVSEGREWTTTDVTGVGAYSELQYPICGLFGQTTPVQIGTTGAYTWTTQGGINTIDNGQTYTIEIGDANNAERVSDALFTDLDFTLTRKSIAIKGKTIGTLLDTSFASLSSGSAVSEVQTITENGAPTGGTFTITFNGQTTAPIAQAALSTAVATALNALPAAQTTGFAVSGSAGGPYTVTFQNALAGTFFDTFVCDGSALTGGTNPSVTAAMTTPGHGATPSAITVVPVLPKEGNIYLDTSFGSIGSTKLTGAFQAVISITGKYGPVWPIDRAQSSYAAVVGMEPKTSLKLQQNADSTGKNPLTYLRSGQTVYFRFDYLSGSIAGSSGNNPYRWTLDMAAKVKTIGKFGDAEGVYVLDYTFQPVADPTSGFAFKSTLINSQAAL